MASSKRDKQDDDLQREIKPCQRLFFLNEDLVRVINTNRGFNIVNLFNLTKDKEQSMLLSDFKKYRKRAYTVASTAKLLNRGPAQMYRYMNEGLIKHPTGSLPGGERMFTQLSFYSEDDIFEIREAMSKIHRGRPRKDGKISNSVLTEQELRAKMGDALMLYTRTKDGEFVPVWSEQTY